MKLLSLSLLLAAAIFVTGCKDKIINPDVLYTDPHPARLIYFEARTSDDFTSGSLPDGDLSENANISVALHSLDTVSMKLVLIDDDALIQCDLLLDKQPAIWGFPPKDTLVLEFGFFPDSADYKINTIKNQSALFKDMLGYEKKIQWTIFMVPEIRTEDRK
ncbi:MAG TPA: hypothetical protein VMT35_08565 [Ignavibacteriaceae bacterium]|nr:hypothetical protein [Ignavibacteriaceae bacterium]